MLHNPYEDHYLKQAYGGGLPVFIGGQRGRGIGGIFNGLARMIIPVLKRTGKTVLKEGLRSGVDVLGDIVSGQNVKSSFKKRAKQAGTRLVDQSMKSLGGISKHSIPPPGQSVKKGIKRKNPFQNRQSGNNRQSSTIKNRHSKKRQKRRTDIFS